MSKDNNSQMSYGSGEAESLELIRVSENELRIISHSSKLPHSRISMIQDLLKCASGIPWDINLKDLR